MSPLTVGSLFSGIGGIELGLEKTGYFKTAWQCEIDQDAQRVLRKHWPNTHVFSDVSALVDPPTVDVLCGGFPCQDVSVAGAGVGVAGHRSGLYTEFVRLIDTVRPTYAVIENVKMLLSRGLNVILQDLATIGYDAEWTTLRAEWFGAPIRRERVFIVAYPTSLRLEKSASVFAEGRDVCTNESAAVQTSWNGVSINREKPEEYGLLLSKPPVLRMADGVSRWSYVSRKEYIRRITQLGNAVIPDMAFYVGSCIASFDRKYVHDKR